MRYEVKIVQTFSASAVVEAADAAEAEEVAETLVADGAIDVVAMKGTLRPYGGSGVSATCIGPTDRPATARGGRDG